MLPIYWNRNNQEVIIYSHHLLILKKKETVEELINNKIGIALIYHIVKTKCMRCQTDYISCDCVKFIDDTSEEIQNCKFLGAAWTNRHA